MKAHTRASRPPTSPRPDEAQWSAGSARIDEFGRGEESRAPTALARAARVPPCRAPPRTRRRRRSRRRRIPGHRHLPRSPHPTPPRRRRRERAVNADELERLLVVQEHDLALDRLRHRRASRCPSARELQANQRSIGYARRAAATHSAHSGTPCAPTRSASTTKPRRSARAQPRSTRSCTRATSARPASSRRCRPTRHAQAPSRDLEDRELEVMEQRETLDTEITKAEGEQRALGTDDVTRLAVDDRRRGGRDRRRGRDRNRGAGGARRGRDRRRCCAGLRAAPGQEPRRRRGAARRHDLPGLPPHDPVDRSGTDPACRPAKKSRTATTAARSSCREPALVRRLERRRRDRPAEVLIYCDGGSRGNPGPAAIGAVVLDPSTEPPTRVATVSETIGIATNNVAEYKALIAGLEAAHPCERIVVRVRADSLLMIKQVAGEYRVRQAHLAPLHARVKELLRTYDEVDLQHVRRELNTRRRRAGERRAGRRARHDPLARLRFDLRRLERLPELRPRLPAGRDRCARCHS